VAGRAMVVHEGNWVINPCPDLSALLYIYHRTANIIYRDVPGPIPRRSTRDTDFTTGRLHAARFIPSDPQYCQG